MPDSLSQDERSALMSRIRSVGTGDERLLQRALRARSIRCVRNDASLPGKPDFVSRAHRLAVFVDGEYWHGRQWRARGLRFLNEQFGDDAKAPYWVSKIQRNVARDIQRTSLLLDEGWAVLRVWDSDVRNDARAIARRVERFLGAGRGAGRGAVNALGRAGDLFAGVGLMRLGLEGAGWNTVWAHDDDATNRRLYLHNLGARPVRLEGRSIHDVGARSIPSVGLIGARLPGAERSLARGAAKPISRFAELLSGLGARRPPFVILEAPTALMRHDAGRGIAAILRRLAEAGYTHDAVVLDARWFVPQGRPRLFVVGARS